MILISLGSFLILISRVFIVDCAGEHFSALNPRCVVVFLRSVYDDLLDPDRSRPKSLPDPDCASLGAIIPVVNLQSPVHSPFAAHKLRVEKLNHHGVDTLIS